MISAEEKESKIIHRSPYITATEKNKTSSHSSTERSQSVEERIERPQDSENSNISLSPPASSTQAYVNNSLLIARSQTSHLVDKNRRVVLDRLEIPVPDSDSGSNSSSPISMSAPVSPLFGHSLVEILT